MDVSRPEECPSPHNHLLYSRRPQQGSDSSITRLDHILSLILQSLPHSKVIVAGDFNQQMDQAYKICHKYGLEGTIKDGTPTHSKGGHLDQIFTNIGGLQAKVEDTDLSDHK